MIVVGVHVILVFNSFLYIAARDCGCTIFKNLRVNLVARIVRTYSGSRGWLVQHMLVCRRLLT